jgi:tetratricopeptide (TPR) repeat protein
MPCGIAGQAAQAQPFFERLMRDRPGHAAGAYGLARVRGELGDWAGALRLYEQAQGLKDAADWPLAYRMGIALQQLGRTDEAKAAYKRFVTAGKGQKASLDDARKRLEQLGG